VPRASRYSTPGVTSNAPTLCPESTRACASAI